MWDADKETDSEEAAWPLIRAAIAADGRSQDGDRRVVKMGLGITDDMAAGLRRNHSVDHYVSRRGVDV